MGLGYKLTAMIRWTLPPVQTPLSCGSSSPFSCSSSSRGKEVNFDTSKLSLTTLIPEDNEMARKDSLVAHSCLSSVPQAIEIDYSNPEMTTRKRSRKDLPILMSKGQTGRTEMDQSVTLASALAHTKSHYQLLMESVHVLEDRISSSNSIDLERNILIQLGRLGALELFRKCLSRTNVGQPTSRLCYKPNELIGDNERETSTLCDVTNVIICSRKKGKRNSRRENPLKKVGKLSSEGFHHGVSRSLVSSSSKKKAKVKSRKEMIARNEAEMACGVKVVANLERIRLVMEKETGREVSLSSWAEAAGIDKKLLQQRLKFGWQCRDELIKSARSLVLFLAKSYRGLGIAHEDIIQAGNIGVLQGAERFDHTRGYQFSTYVQYWIRKAMSMLVARHSRGIKIPATLGSAISRIQKARKALQLTCGEYPDDMEIAKFTGLSLKKIESAGKCLRVVGSTDRNIGDWSSAKLSECTLDTTIDSPERTVIRKLMRIEVASLLNELDPKERQVIVLRFGFGGRSCKSLHEVGKLFDVSKEWIRRVEKKALAKLRVEEKKRDLKHYIEF